MVKGLSWLRVWQPRQKRRSLSRARADRDSECDRLSGVAQVEPLESTVQLLQADMVRRSEEAGALKEGLLRMEMALQSALSEVTEDMQRMRWQLQELSSHQDAAPKKCDQPGPRNARNMQEQPVNAAGGTWGMAEAMPQLNALQSAQTSIMRRLSKFEEDLGGRVTKDQLFATRQSLTAALENKVQEVKMAIGAKADSQDLCPMRSALSSAQTEIAGLATSLCDLARQEAGLELRAQQLEGSSSAAQLELQRLTDALRGRAFVTQVQQLQTLFGGMQEQLSALQEDQQHLKSQQVMLMSRVAQSREGSRPPTQMAALPYESCCDTSPFDDAQALRVQRSLTSNSLMITNGRSGMIPSDRTSTELTPSETT